MGSFSNRFPFAGINQFGTSPPTPHQLSGSNIYKRPPGKFKYFVTVCWTPDI